MISHCSFDLHFSNNAKTDNDAKPDKTQQEQRNVDYLWPLKFWDLKLFSLKNKPSSRAWLAGLTGQVGNKWTGFVEFTTSRCKALQGLFQPGRAKMKSQEGTHWKQEYGRSFVVQFSSLRHQKGETASVTAGGQWFKHSGLTTIPAKLGTSRGGLWSSGRLTVNLNYYPTIR